MNMKNPLEFSTPALSWIGVVIIVLPVLYSLGACVIGGGGGDERFLAEPTQTEEGCLRETPYMRYQHMDFLKELRDAGVRGGARRDVSFATCRGCHTYRGDFCDRCHDAVNLTPDCFQCHYYPKDPTDVIEAR